MTTWNDFYETPNGWFRRERICGGSVESRHTGMLELSDEASRSAPRCTIGAATGLNSERQDSRGKRPARRNPWKGQVGMRPVKFNELKSCPKCGSRNVRRAYCNEPRYAELCHEQNVTREHHHRNCQGCHYEWLEWCKPKADVLLAELGKE